MRTFTQLLKNVGILYIILAVGFSAFIYLYPSKFIAGSPINTIIFNSSLGAFFLLVTLCLVYWIIFRPANNVVVNYNWVHIVIYVLLLINGAFCLSGPNGAEKSGLTIAPSDLELVFAVLMTLGFFVLVGAQNILKNLSGFVQK